jgi:hypothetical protein
VRRRLQSHRFRRRLFGGSVFVAVTGVVVVGSILIGNTGRDLGQHDQPTGGKPWVYREPKKLRLTNALRQRLLAESLQFVQTAVTRADVDRAYDLASPGLREGMTRREWNTGNIPVVPYHAAGIIGWNVGYSYTDEVALNLALVGEKGADTVGKSFTIDLKRYGDRWLVDSWTPNGISGSTNVISLHKLANEPPPKAPLAATWLLVPLSVLGLVLAVPVALGIRAWLIARRALRAYEAERNASGTLR